MLRMGTSLNSLSPLEAPFRMHNNIVLEAPWPPIPHSVASDALMRQGGGSSQAPRFRSSDPLLKDCSTSCPYLEHPPAIINISLGRQLFVDDFLIESLSRLTRSMNKLRIEGKVGETEGSGWLPGVVYDPLFGMYRMFVLCRESASSDRNCLCHRTSTDGPASSGLFCSNRRQSVVKPFFKKGKLWTNPVYNHVVVGSSIVLKYGPEW